MKAYTVQQLKKDPDQIMHSINYHICLVTKNRESLLEKIDIKKIETSSMFQNISNKYESEIYILYTSSDHIHLHVNTTPDYSIDEVVKQIVKGLNLSLQSKYPELLGSGEIIFEVPYFVETIG